MRYLLFSFLAVFVFLFIFPLFLHGYAQYPTPTPIPATPTPTPLPSLYIQGTVFQDVNRNGSYDGGDIPLWSKNVQLSGASTATGTTDASGNYLFGPYYPGGSYTVSYTPDAGYQLTTSGSVSFTLNATTTVNFGVAIPPSPTINPNPPSTSCSGNNPQVSLSYSSSGAQWYTIFAEGISNPVYSGPNTSYTHILDVSNNNRQNYYYTIRAYYNPNPSASDAYSSSTTSLFNLPDCYYQVTGNVFLDTNRNGIKDGTEQGYGTGATISIRGTNSSDTTSNGSGNYTFSSLLAGNNTVSIQVPSGYIATTSTAVILNLTGNATVDFGITNVLVGSGQTACNSSYTYNGTTYPSIWRPNDGRWYPVNSALYDTQWGQSGDIPVPGDYDGDGTTDIAVWRPANGTAYIFNISNSVWGQEGDIPVPGDYDGDGTTNFGVFRPSNGYWYINAAPDLSIFWGQEGDIPVPGDYDGDGTTDIAVWRPANGTWYIYGGSAVAYGQAGDVPVPGDYNGDGTTDRGVWRYTDGKWYVEGVYPGGYQHGQAGDIPVACSIPTNAFSISGNVALDYQNDGTSDAAFANGATLTLTGGGITPRTTTTDSFGNYIFTNVRPKGPTDYTVTLTNPNARYAINPSTALSVTVGPNKTGVNFQLVPRYQISGVVFDDRSKDGIKNGAEPNMSGNYTIHIQGSSINSDFTATNGVYSSGTILPEGQYTVTYTSAIPSGYRITNPTNCIGNCSFTVTVGRSCTVNGSLGASCTSAGLPFTASDVQNLNFGMTNNSPWFQIVCSNARIDGSITNDGSTQTGFSDPIPDTASPACGGPNASITAPICTTPGIIFSGSTADFGQGQASTPQNWQVNSFYTPTSIDTSYGYMTTTLRQSGITPIDLATVCTLSSCTLPAGMPNGIYLANSAVTLNAYTFAANKSYVFLINGNLTITGDIHIPLGSSGIFSVAGDITIDRSVGVGTGASNYCSQASNVEGLFSADGSFIIDGINDCSVFPIQQDQRLNVAGAIVVNAAKTGGSLQNRRDLCDDDRFAPAFSIIGRPDFLLSAPEFIKKKSDVWQEVAP